MGASIGPASTGGGRGGRFARGNASRAPLNEINITPLVDVMLVLLVVFMVAAPMMTGGINVNLPKTAAKQLPSDNKPPLTVSIDKDARIFCDKTEVSIEALGTALQSATKGEGLPADEKIFLKADKAVDYGKVMQVMSRLNALGYRKIALLTEHGAVP